MKNNTRNMSLASYDDLFFTEESRAQADMEKVMEISLDELHPFPNHPFKVEQDEAFGALVESVRNHGVLHRIIIRPREKGGYEIVAGHRRVEACRKLGLTEIIADLRRDMGNDQAIGYPSEYRMVCSRQPYS